MSAGADEKTEQPTQHKLREARKKGQAAKSRDLSASVELLGAIVLLRFGGWFIGEYTLDFMQQIMEQDFPAAAAPAGKEILPQAMRWAVFMGVMIMPFMILLCLVAYLANYLQVGWLYSTEPLKLNFNKLNPVTGLRRIFALKNLMTLAMNLAKLAVIMPIAWQTIIGELRNVIILVEMEPAGTLIYMSRAVLDLALKLALLLFVLGVADWYYQKYVFTRGMKMTKQEVKEEYKQMEGDPKIKQKRRQIQMQQAMKRMMSEVPQAEVVVRNPTHFAVAISYKPEMPAPVVVAKGKDAVAEKIIAAAREAGVPTVENPPLARELYRLVEVGDEIPETLFTAVAEILSSVIDAEKRQKIMNALAGSAA